MVADAVAAEGESREAMLEAEYATMFASEETYWWYQGLHDQAKKALERCRQAVPGPFRLLDAGCGTGRMLELAGGDATVGLDLSGTALSLARRRTARPLARASVAAVPFRDASFDAVLSLDVLANLPGDGPARALADFRRVLVPGGRLVLNLVAFQGLYSEHDRAVGVVRRYRRREVGVLLAGAGFDIEVLTYANTVLFPVAALVRLWRRRPHGDGHAPRSDLSPLPGPVNAALARLRFFENDLILGRGVSLPFGLSVFAVARNPVNP